MAAPRRVGSQLAPGPNKTDPQECAWKDGERRWYPENGRQVALDVGGLLMEGTAVVCVENDSPDINTQGNEDLSDPAAGEAYFYAFRGSQGLATGAGSYGQASDGRERMPLAGDCN